MINDINIDEAVLNIVENDGAKQIYTSEKLNITDDLIYNFILKHTEKTLKSDKLKYANWKNEQEEGIKHFCNQFFNKKMTVIELGEKITEKLKGIMNQNNLIPSGDLIVESLISENGPVIGILKVDYIENVKHTVDENADKLAIKLISEKSLTSNKIKKAAFILKNNKTMNCDLLVLDERGKAKAEDYRVDFFENDFLDCEMFKNDRDKTKEFVGVAEKFLKNKDMNPLELVKTRDKLIQTLKEENIVNTEDIADELFSDKDTREEFNEIVKKKLDDTEINLDKDWLDNKYKKMKLKLDNEIEINIPEELYLDKNKFSIIQNGDNTVSVTLKFIKEITSK